MEKELFNHLLVNFTSLTSNEAEALASLANEFPYSQVIHNLAARAAQDNQLGSKEKLLITSAIYSTDRSALKSMMTAPVRARVEFQPAPVVKETVELLVETTTHAIAEAPSGHQSTDQLVDRLMADFATMHESKKAFEQLIESLEGGKTVPLGVAELKKEKITFEPQPAETSSGDLIEEIKITKKKIDPESTRQIEQIEIIDQFIKTQPSISRVKSTPPPVESNDLSEPSEQFGENIVSETLVEILLKQGKKEKAIEALKKLIWKFPQKKAYFAAQIEDLRK